jgi:hypothetical protein
VYLYRTDDCWEMPPRHVLFAKLNRPHEFKKDMEGWKNKTKAAFQKSKNARWSEEGVAAPERLGIRER